MSKRNEFKRQEGVMRVVCKKSTGAFTAGKEYNAKKIAQPRYTGKTETYLVKDDQGGERVIIPNVRSLKYWKFFTTPVIRMMQEPVGVFKTVGV